MTVVDIIVLCIHFAMLDRTTQIEVMPGGAAALSLKLVVGHDRRLKIEDLENDNIDAGRSHGNVEGWRFRPFPETGLRYCRKSHDRSNWYRMGIKLGNTRHL